MSNESIFGLCVSCSIALVTFAIYWLVTYIVDLKTKLTEFRRGVVKLENKDDKEVYRKESKCIFCGRTDFKDNMRLFDISVAGDYGSYDRLNKKCDYSTSIREIDKVIANKHSLEIKVNAVCSNCFTGRDRAKITNRGLLYPITPKKGKTEWWTWEEIKRNVSTKANLTRKLQSFAEEKREFEKLKNTTKKRTTKKATAKKKK